MRRNAILSDVPTFVQRPTFSLVVDAVCGSRRGDAACARTVAAAVRDARWMKIAFGSEALALAVVDGGGIGVIVTSMNTNTSSICVCLNGCGALWNMSW